MKLLLALLLLLAGCSNTRLACRDGGLYANRGTMDGVTVGPGCP
jgi:hypothetical protein